MQKQMEFEADEKEVVAKANDLVRARHSLSTIEQRIFATMVANLERGEDEFRVQKISLRRICDLSGTDKSNVYRKADQIADNLLERSVEVKRETEDGSREFTKYNCFSLCRHREGSGNIEAKFNDDMRPYLLRLKEKFTLYLIGVFLRLRSKYSTQIYELLKMRQGLRRLKISVDELRRTLALEDKYKRFTDLRKRVIEQARRELSKKADIYFTYKVYRKNNSPKEIDFYIHENEEVVKEIREQAEGVPDGATGRKDIIREDETKKEQKSYDKKNVKQESKPSIDAMAIFKSNLDQEELQSISETKLNQLYKEARDAAQKQNSNAGGVYIESITAKKMEEVWRKSRQD
jgi:plasmid replication initiation protein